MMVFDEEDYDVLEGTVFGFYDLHPRDDITEEEGVEYSIDFFFNTTASNAILFLRRNYRVIQKFLRIFHREEKPGEMSWTDFVMQYRYIANDNEAYEWICRISKLYAEKLFEKGVITEDEKNRLFNGELIEEVNI